MSRPWTLQRVDFLATYRDDYEATSVFIELDNAPQWFDGALPWVGGAKQQDLEEDDDHMRPARLHHTHGWARGRIEDTEAWAIYLDQVGRQQIDRDALEHEKRRQARLRYLESIDERETLRQKRRREWVRERERLTRESNASESKPIGLWDIGKG